MSAPDAMAGKKGSCPKCGAPVVAPPGGPPAQPEAPAALDELRKAVEGPAAAAPAGAAKQPRQRPAATSRAPTPPKKKPKGKPNRIWTWPKLVILKAAKLKERLPKREKKPREPKPTKQCPACARTIPEKAKRCPCCRQWLDQAAMERRLRWLRRWRTVNSKVLRPAVRGLDWVPLPAWVLVFVLVWSLAIFLPGALERAAAASLAEAARRRAPAASTRPATRPAAPPKDKESPRKTGAGAPADQAAGGTPGLRHEGA